MSPGDTKNTSNSKDEVITDGINNENQESTSTDQGSASDTSTTNGTTITTDETNASSTASSNVAASTTTRLTKPQTSQSTDTLINAPVNYIQPVHLRPQLIGIRPTQSEFPSYSRPVTGYQGLQALTGYQRPFYVSGQQFGYHRPQTTLTGGGPIWESSGSYGHARPSTNVVSTVGSSQVSPTQVRIPYTSGRRTIPVFLPIQKRPVIAGQGSTNVRLSSTHTNRGVVGFQTLYSQRSPSATSGYSTQQRPQFYPNYNRVHQPPNVVSNRGYQSTFY